MEVEMVDSTTETTNINEQFDNLQRELEEDINQRLDPNLEQPRPRDNSTSTDNTSSSTDNTTSDNEDNSTPPPIPQNNYDESYTGDGVSHAYGLKQMGGKKEPSSVKHHSGVGKAPQREKLKYKPDSSSNFLQACYNEILMPMYAGTIDLGVNLTLDLADWILFAPFSNDKPAEKKKDKNQEKTAFDFGDEIIAENVKKGEELKLAFISRHKELVDNIKKAQNGQTPTWEAWGGQEAQCYSHLVEVYAKAEADPNSPEAKVWQDFVTLPQKALREIDNQVTILNFATHHAVVSTNEADVTPLPPEAPKSFHAMEQMLADPNLDDTMLKSNLTREITELQQHLGEDTQANREIKEKLNELSQILITPNSTKEQMGEKIAELKDIHPLKLQIKENVAVINEKILQGLADIKAQYADNPQQAKKAMQEYVKRIHDTQEIAIDAVKKRDAAGRFRRKKSQTKADTAVTAAQNTINEPPSNPTNHVQRKEQVKTVKDIENIINYVGLQR